MGAADKGTRDLLPVFQADPQQGMWHETEFKGDVAPMRTDLPSSSPTAIYADEVAPLHDEATEGEAAASPMPGAAPILTEPSGPQLSVVEGDGIRMISVSVADAPAGPAPSAANPAGHVAQGTPTVQDETQGRDGDGSDGGAAAEPQDVEGAPDHTHTIDVTQTAEVEQTAKIIVGGYVGEVVARLQIDQNLKMDQDLDLSFTIDGDGRFAVVLDQDMRIDQDIEVDVNVFDEDDVLHIDVLLRDWVDVEQDTDLEVWIGDGPAGGMVEVNQDLELDQDVDIDIDIEDDLEARYIVKVDVEIVQDVDAEQAAVVDITDFYGEIDVDVDATQTAMIDQETIVRADFTLL